jgi:hypothetical protein
VRDLIEAIPFESKIEILECLDENGKNPKLPKGIIMQVRAKVGHAGQITANGRLYTKTLMKRETKRIQARLERRAVHVLSGHPKPDEQPDPDKRIGLLTGLKIESDGGMFASLDVLPSTSGKNFAVAARAGAEVGFSSRGPGTATIVRFNDQHEAFSESNKDWKGKEIEDVDDNFNLNTYDHVLGPAVEDAVGLNYNEDIQGEKVMPKFEIKELTDAQWIDILAAGQVTEAIKVAIEAAVKEHDTDSIKEAIKTEAAKFVKENFEANKPDPVEKPKLIECSICKAQINESSKFCPECGRVPLTEQTQEPDEKDAEIEKLKVEADKQIKELAALKGVVDGMTEAEKDRTKANEVEAIVAETLKGKPHVVCEDVRDRLEGREMTVENALDTVEGLIEKSEALVKTVHGTLTEAGEGKTLPADELSEQELADQKNQLNPEAAVMLKTVNR